MYGFSRLSSLIDESNIIPLISTDKVVWPTSRPRLPRPRLVSLFNRLIRVFPRRSEGGMVDEISRMWTYLQSLLFRDAKASKIYGRVVAQARQPVFYARHGVPDTPEGRYELVVMHLWLAVDRLQRIGPDGQRLARILTERFVEDIDDNLREMGVGDMVVPKKVKRAAAGLLERADMYKGALRGDGESALRDALAHFFAVAPEAKLQAALLADYMESAHRMLATQTDTDVLSGRLQFPLVD